jgi:hypothetical protein
MDYMSGEVNVLALVRGEEQYIFVFDPSRRTELLRLLGRYAADPELAFNWFDAAILSHKIREMMPAAITASEGASSSSIGMQADYDIPKPSKPKSGFSSKTQPRFQIPRS